MKILMVIPYVPSQIRIRPYQFLRGLAKLGHQITLATVWSNEQEYLELQELRPYCSRILARRQPRWRSLWNCLLALPGRNPLQSVYSWNGALATEISGLAQNGDFDVAHVEHLRGAKYGIALKTLLQQRGMPQPVVWDSVDAISLLFRLAAQENTQLNTRLITSLEIDRTEWFEGKMVDFFDHVLVTSPIDRQALLELQTEKPDKPPLSVIPNGVDLEYFKPDPHIPREDNLIVVSGKMSYHANVAMALYLVNEIMPLVWERKPDARVAIVGKDPPAVVRSLAEDRRVTVTGTVPDLRVYLQRATIAAAPIRYGVGVQNKVLEAMACGAPVVATRGITAGIHAQAGEEILVADNPLAFAEEVIKLLEHPEKRHALSLAGRRFVEKNHNWDEICTKLTEIYAEAGIRVRNHR